MQVRNFHAGCALCAICAGILLAVRASALSPAVPVSSSAATARSVRSHAAPNRVARRTASPAKKKDEPTAAALCESRDITVELPREFLPLAVQNSSFVARNNSVSAITFQNYFTQPIREIAIVAENEDQDGKLLFANVFAASANSTVSPTWFSAYLPSQYDITPWAKPIAPRANFTLVATSGITTSVCPSQIKATVVHMEFADHTQLNYSTPGWQLPAQPEQIPGALEFYVLPRNLPEEFTVNVHVPAPLGPIIPPPVITLTDGRQSVVFERIREQMQDWRFAFAIRNGISVDGNETLLVRLHSPKEKFSPKSFWIARDEVPAPMGVVDLIPMKAPDKWAVYYGGVDLSSVSPPQMQ